MKVTVTPGIIGISSVSFAPIADGVYSCIIDCSSKYPQLDYFVGGHDHYSIVLTADERTLKKTRYKRSTEVSFDIENHSIMSYMGNRYGFTLLLMSDKVRDAMKYEMCRVRFQA